MSPDTSAASGAVVETSVLTDSTGQHVHVRLSSRSLSVTADGRPPLTYDVDDLVGCTSTQQTQTLALHFYPQSLPSCLPLSSPDRVHSELLLTAPDQSTASLWTIYFNRAARRLPIDKAPLPARNLLILINPASGTGDAPKKAEVVTPTFRHSGIPFNITATTHAGHAHQIAHAAPLHTPTSIVCISGDGLLYEVINGLLSRPDWAEAVRHVTLGVIAGGSGNGLAKSITRVSCEPNSLVAQAFLIIKGWKRPLDIATVRQAGRRPVFSFVSLAWALISDIDFLSERWRWMGDVRFTLAAVISLVSPRRHQARLSYLPVEDATPRHRDTMHLTEGHSKSKALLQSGACKLHGQCAQCLKDGEDGEWEALQRYLDESNDSLGEVELKEEGGRWRSVDAEFTLLWALNIPWVTKDIQAAPLSHFSESAQLHCTSITEPQLGDDFADSTLLLISLCCLHSGCLDLLYVRHISRLGSLQLMAHFESGEHILSRDVDYCKVKAVRVDPEQGEHCDLCIDGEHCPYAPLEMRQWRGILQMHSR